MSKPLFAVLLAANLLLRFTLMWQPGYVPDVDSYKNWALGRVIVGLPNAYAETGRVGAGLVD